MSLASVLVAENPERWSHAAGRRHLEVFPYHISARHMTGHRPRRSSKSAPGAGHALKRRSA